MKQLVQRILLLGLTLTIISFGVRTEQEEPNVSNEYIKWGDRKLNWDDFSGDIPVDSKFDALTHSAINLEFEGEGHLLKFNIETIFDPSKSWKKEGVDKYILNHEQVHFDITEYHARIFRKKLKTRRYKSYDTIEKKITDLFNESFKTASEMQVLYDNQTNHSINRRKQDKWNKKVKNMLSETSSYKNPKLNVNVSYLTN